MYSHVFVSYVACVVMAGGTPVIVSLKEEDKFKLKKEQLEAAVTDKTKAMIISFPNNPTGAIMTKEELEPIAEFAKEHDIVVNFLMRFYSELTYGRDHVSIASLPEMKDRSIVIKWIFQGICNDWMETWLCCSTKVHDENRWSRFISSVSWQHRRLVSMQRSKRCVPVMMKSKR